jgi:hypothetical protein
MIETRTRRDEMIKKERADKVSESFLTRCKTKLTIEAKRLSKEWNGRNVKDRKVHGYGYESLKLPEVP